MFVLIESATSSGSLYHRIKWIVKVSNGYLNIFLSESISVWVSFYSTLCQVV